MGNNMNIVMRAAHYSSEGRYVMKHGWQRGKPACSDSTGVAGITAHASIFTPKPTSCRCCRCQKWKSLHFLCGRATLESIMGHSLFMTAVVRASRHTLRGTALITGGRIEVDLHKSKCYWLEAFIAADKLASQSGEGPGVTATGGREEWLLSIQVSPVAMTVWWLIGRHKGREGDTAQRNSLHFIYKVIITGLCDMSASTLMYFPTYSIVKRRKTLTLGWCVQFQSILPAFRIRNNHLIITVKQSFYTVIMRYKIVRHVYA